MSNRSPLFLITALFLLAVTSQALAFGEGVLAQTGQYTFFIRPEPASCITYYQKLVPCVAEETIPVPRRVTPVFPLPVPAIRNQPVMISERPVGCAEGAGPCVQCFPKASHKRYAHRIVDPRIVPVKVPDIEIVPRLVTRPVLRPQWFEVTESPLPPQPVRKVHAGG